MIIKNSLDCCWTALTAYSVSAMRVCSKDLCECTQQLCRFSGHFCLCVHKHCMDMHTEEKYPVYMHLCLGCRLGLQRGADCWSTGMNGSCHLLSLVSQMEKGCTIQSEQSRVTNEWDISAERQTEWLMDNRKTYRSRKRSEKKKY